MNGYIPMTLEQRRAKRLARIEQRIEALKLILDKDPTNKTHKKTMVRLLYSIKYIQTNEAVSLYKLFQLSDLILDEKIGIQGAMNELDRLISSMHMPRAHPQEKTLTRLLSAYFVALLEK